MRFYRRKPDARRYGSVTQLKFDKAMSELKSGRSQRYVCEKYKIPGGTLQNKLAKRHGKKPGHQTVLSDVEEKAVVEPLLTGVSRWTRHGESLTHRLCQNISAKRAQGNKGTISKYFDNLQESLNGVPPENIVHYDETNVTDDPGRKHSIFRRGIKYLDRVMNSTKTSTSLMCAASAAVELLPVYVVYKAENMWDTCTKGGPEDARYSRSKSGIGIVRQCMF